MCRHRQQNMAEKKNDEGFEETAFRDITLRQTMAWIEQEERTKATDLEKSLLGDLYTNKPAHRVRLMKKKLHNRSYFDELLDDIGITSMSVFGEDEEEEDEDEDEERVRSR